MNILPVLLSVFISLFSQTNQSMVTNFDYSKAWLEVDSLMNQGLPKSALDKVYTIYQYAEKENNRSNTIKSYIYITNLTIQTEEEGIEKSIQFFKTIIQNGKQPYASFANSYLASLYQTYFTQNRYTISQRTNLLVNDSSVQFRNWTSNQFIEEIGKKYLASIKDQADLQTSSSELKEVFQTTEKVDIELRPTIYDLLLDRAMQYFVSTAHDGYDRLIELDDVDLLADYPTFIQKDFGLDTTSTRAKIVTLFQKALQLHSPDTKIHHDIDLMRLNTVYGMGSMPNKHILYKNALEKLLKRAENTDYYTTVAETLARTIMSRNDDSLSNSLALDICKKAIAKYPNSPGASLCQNIIHQITAVDVQLKVETGNIPEKPFLVQITYKNISKMNVKVIKIDENFDKMENANEQSVILDHLQKQKALGNQELVLPEDKNYMARHSEVVVEKLPCGYYALALSDEKGVLTYAKIWVTYLSYQSYKVDDKSVISVKNRESGKPISGVTVQLYETNYNNNTTKDKKVFDAKTNSNGQVVLSNFNRSLSIKLMDGKDQLRGNFYTYYSREGNNPDRNIAELYLDRAIYRPGQTVYYKSIVMKLNGVRVPSLIPDADLSIELLDVNNKVISKQDLKTNEFGSVNGQFVLPTSKLSGTFSINVRSKKGVYGSKYFQVEEYKRHSFEVVIDETVQKVKLNDSVLIKGRAQTLAGSNVDGANVIYKVVRNTRFPEWGRYMRIPNYNNGLIISQGELKSDNEGKFVFSFLALPDKEVDKKYDPIFSYTVSIDITDQRGETRSSSKVFSFGYKPYELSIGLEHEILDVADKATVSMGASNPSGGKVEASGKITMYKLVEPKVVQVSKYWEQEPIVLSRVKDFEKLFPQHIYQDSKRFDQWEIEKTIDTKNFDTRDTTDLEFLFPKHGVYKFEAISISEMGDTIVAQTFVEVTDKAKKKFPKSDYLFFNTDKDTYQPGEKAVVSLNTSGQSVYAQILIAQHNKIVEERNVKITDEEQLTIPIVEKHKGGITIIYNYIINNRAFSEVKHIGVPWSDKELTITFESFRDKALPGAQEEYKLKIGGMDAEKVKAELLASMYDASLDFFAANWWQHSFYPNNYTYIPINHSDFNMSMGYLMRMESYPGSYIPLVYPKLLELNNYYGGYEVSDMFMDGVRVTGNRSKQVMRSSGPPPPPPAVEEEIQMKSQDSHATENVIDNNDDNSKEKSPNESLVRANLNELVFFYPNLYTDADGNVILSFTMNEALTKWRLMLLAHTKDFKVGYAEETVRTQKDVMVFPNPPRFFREKDTIVFTSKVSNLSEKAIKGNARIHLFDAINGKDITSELMLSKPELPISINQGLSEGLEWKLAIPENKYNAITYRVIATAGNHSDGEENSLPVISNRMLITESLPLWLNGKETKTFDFKAFAKNDSKTKKDFTYTIEYTTNPIWYAIQALPYMKTQANNNSLFLSEQLFTNLLASQIANANPKIRSVFDQWKNQGSDAMLSNLSKNPNLKNVLLESTPWVNQALSEEEQKRNIALLFDVNNLANQKAETLEKLKEAQLSNGGFPWIPGSNYANVYITQSIVENIGKAYQLGVLSFKDNQFEVISSKALQYIDEEADKRYTELKREIKKYGGNLDDNHLDYTSVHYLYARSFYSHVKPKNTEVYNYYLSQSEKYWNKQVIATQAMIGLILLRNNQSKVVNSIIKSLDERSFDNVELGRYWNEGNGYNWYQLPIERQALLIELYTEAVPTHQGLAKMKLWLLKNKQTNHWPTSKSTVASIYALLSAGEKGKISPILLENELPVIIIGKSNLNIHENQMEAGTGYFSHTYKNEEITKDLSKIKITNNNTSASWGGLYYQYFEDLDKVKKFEETPLTIKKQIFKVVSTNKGDKLEKISNGMKLQPGDKIRIRLDLQVDREMDFVHMKDGRASGLEPKDILSGHKYQGGLYYYQSTLDQATHFYFDSVKKGNYVFEYDLVVVHRGNFSSGIAIIESFYAPEFSSHSEGTRIVINK